MSSRSSELPTARRKLKESCTQCASAKVRCSKDKPYCTRCEDRNSICSYGMSQRSGRRAGSTSLVTPFQPGPTISTTNNATPQATPTQTPTPASAPVSVGDFVPATRSNGAALLPFHYSAIPMSKAGPSGQSISDLDGDALTDTSFPDMLGTYDPNLWSACDSLAWDMMDTKSPGSDLSPGSQVLSNSSLTSLDYWMNMRSDHCSNLSGNDPDINYFSAAHSISMQETPPSPTLLHKASSPDKPSSCYQTATEIIGTINAAPKSCSLVSSSRETTKPPYQQTIEQIIDTNRASIESATFILNCSCAGDQNLLSLIISIIFKIIHLYHSAAHTTSSPRTQANLNVDSFLRQTAHHVPPISASSPARAEDMQIDPCSDGPRMRAQLILGEIHRVVRLVELLSQRFQQVRTTSMGHENETLEGNWISASVFVQLEADLRQRLRVVVKDTMALLKLA
ncbi:hypothetical protein VTL71DRAFT_7418 [Oculimacula yallundae]|uniref:Zn(2)-C6 fungal-type domain-containing protein n=1 Tax=Oculimacula yallundae TaxID=86028 RepID=A0ABR4BU23_9HELO